MNKPTKNNYSEVEYDFIFLDGNKRIRQPVVKECINPKCTNRHSKFFDIVDFKKRGKDQKIRVMFWQIGCPICGAVWYIDVIKQRNYPIKYRNNTQEED